MSRIRILVLEDDSEMREALRETLEDEGYEVTVAQRGEEAVKVASSQQFDLVVTDIKMPGIDGLEALQQVKERQPHVKSLVVTGYSNQEHTIRAVRLGVGDYMRKPFGLEEFVDRIREMVAEYLLERERIRRELVLQEAALGAYRMVAELVDSRLLKSGQLAAFLAAQQGTSESAALQAQIVTLALGIKEISPDMNQPHLGAPLDEYLEAANERWDGSGPEQIEGNEIPLLSRIAALASFRALNPELALPEGWFDPGLVEGLEEESSGSSAGSGDRTLLALGQAMERAADLENAHKAYSELVSGPSEPRSRISALLGLARIEERTGGESLLKFAEEAREVASQLGPSSAARTDLEVGLLLLDHSPESAREFLLEADQSLEQLGDKPSVAQARLGLASLGEASSAVEDSMQLLLDPSQADALVASAVWLLPLALKFPEGREARRLVRRLIREAPDALDGCIKGRRVEVPGRKFLVEALGSAGVRGRRGLQLLARDEESEVSRAARALLGDESEAEPEPFLRLHSFGGFEVSRGDQRISGDGWKHRKVRYLLAYLGRNWRRGVPEEVLLEDFWPGPKDRAKRSLYQATWNLRRCLKPVDAVEVDYVLREQGHLSLNREMPIWNDLEEFEKALEEGQREAREGRAENAFAPYRKASRLYRGVYLEGCFMDWAVRTRETLEPKVMSCLAWLVEHAIEANNSLEALEHGNRMLELDPLNQQGYLLSMKAYLASGQGDKAISLFERCERLLKSELGLEPSIEMLQMYQQVRLSLEGNTLIG